MQVVGMAATALLQIVIVWISGSIGLLADTVHNLGHLVTTIPPIIAFGLGLLAPTRRCSYGFRRAQPRALTNLGWVLAAALIGALGNAVVARYPIRVGRRISSAALVAEGQHARTDALTSLAVVIGAVGAWLGFPQVDAVVGLVIAAVIILVLVQSMRTTINPPHGRRRRGRDRAHRDGRRSCPGRAAPGPGQRPRLPGADVLTRRHARSRGEAPTSVVSPPGSPGRLGP
ncbi:cation diffusion facilitator family transporter [Ornithinimicrobium sp. LYQ121]|uniref:cation diffusion facilitator family transporter n=1 Tax=Ornithinimicrobium sp. LYQ121 TaxID=3378801 RepID=UPI0038525ECE